MLEVRTGSTFRAFAPAPEAVILKEILGRWGR
jgi:hypothetical protein